jgi:class I fructose-bisphosphate aldolase
MAIAQGILRPDGGLTIAMDHGLNGVPRGLEAPPARVRELLGYAPDGVIITVGMLRALGKEISGRGIVPILAVDAAISEEGKVIGHADVALFEQCAWLGCGIAKIVFQLGWRDEAFCAEISRIAAAVAAAQRTGTLIMVEPAMIGGDPADWAGARSTARIKDGCRISSELGADLLKIPMLSQDDVREVVEMSYCPVTVMGGDATDQATFLGQVAESLAGGARGIVAGRNVWQESRESEVVAGLRNLLAAD